MINSILLDVMVGEHHVCQFTYPCSSIELFDGRVIPLVNEDEVQKFIEERRPSLKYKKYHVEFSNQKV